MRLSRWLRGWTVVGLLCSGVLGSAAAAAPPENTAQRTRLIKTQSQGNYKDAYEGFRKLALDPNDDHLQVGEDLHRGIECLRQINRISEIDEFCEAVIQVHQGNWRLLHTAAHQYMEIPHQGFIVAGQFHRGPHRGGGRMVNSVERDRIRALQLMNQALPLAGQDDNRLAVSSYLLAFARMLLNNRSYHDAWRLQYKSDLGELPDYEPGYGHHRQSSGAPVDEEGKPVYHYAPRRFEDARTDGQRWRWCLQQAMEVDPRCRYRVRTDFADFLFNQFGVQTMAQYGWRFGRMRTDDTGQDQSGTYALHTLGENETIARLATGVKRFELPDEFNFIKIYQELARQPGQPFPLERLATIFENRRQYPRAAEYWQRLLKQFSRTDPDVRERWQQRLDQIVKNWGRFEPIVTQPAGKGATVEYRFRNGSTVELTAHRVNVPKLLEDVKDYLKSGPAQLDGNKLNIGNIGYKLVHQNQRQYVGQQVARWKMIVNPRTDHFDKRVTVTTPLQQPGAYLLTARMEGGNTSHVIVWLSDTAIVKKPLSEKTYYFVADAVSGRPIAGANLEFFGYQQKRVATRQYRVITKQFAKLTGRDGQVVPDPAQQPRNFQWIITARTDQGRFAYLGFTRAWYSRHYDAEYRATKAFAVTDRPVYRPQQTVHYKFWVRHAQYDKEDTSDYAGVKLGVEIRNPKGERIVQQEFTADAYGGIEGKLELPADATLGVYRMIVGQFGSAPPGAATRPTGPAVPGAARMLPGGGPLGKPAADVGGRKFARAFGGGSFRVEEYKKPEFEVNVDAPKEPVMLGEKITATIEAKYYFGSPVTEAKVKYKVMRTSVSKPWYPICPWDWFYGPGYWWYGYDYDWYPGFKFWGCRRPVPFWWPRRSAPPELVADREVEIGPDGTVKVEIDTAVAKAVHPDQDHRYSITAEVVDRSRRTIVGTGEVLVARKPFTVYTWVDRGYFRVGDVIQSHCQARTLDGKPVKGKGTLRLLRITYRDGQPVETPVDTYDLPTNEEGRCQQKLKASRAGQYRLSYELTDSQDHTIQGGYIFTVVGEGFDGSQFRFSNLELVPDKREYAPGDTVKLQINTDRTGGTVLLFTRPANGVYLPPKVIRLAGKSTIWEIGVVKKDMPNFFVEAITIADGRTHIESKEIVVPPEKRVLSVELKPSSETYKPGQKAKVQIRLTDFSGEPFSGSTVVAVYDKSVEYISGGSNVPDIKEFFWKWRRRHRPRTETSLARRFGNLVPPDRKAMANLGAFGGSVVDDLDSTEGFASDRNGVAPQIRRASGRGGFGGGAPGLVRSPAAPMSARANALETMDAAPAEAIGADRTLAMAGKPAGPSPAAEMVQPTVRTKFADTALWVGALSTDKRGTAEIELAMPENLTTWRIKVWGMGHGTKVGEGVTDVVTRKDLIVRLQAPRFFVQKDEVVLSANVHNYLKTKKTVRVELELEGDCLQALQTIELPGRRGMVETEFGPTSEPEEVTLGTTDPLPRAVEIEPGGEARVDWRVSVLKEGQAVVRMKALTDEESDAMEMTFPCYVHGMLKMDSYSGSIRPAERSGKFTVTVPKQRRPEQTRLEVRYSPTLAGAMVDALPYLVDYPYGCTEQTLNRFLPTVVTQKVLIEMGLDLEDINKKRANLNAQEIGDDRERAKGWQRYDRNPVFDQAEVRRMVEQGVNRLTEMQNSDGGWGWFSGWGERSYPHTTAYVVHGLQTARQNDVALVPGVLEKGVAWLGRYQAEQVRRLVNGLKSPPVKPWKPRADNLDAFVYMVLVDAGVKNPQMMDFLYRDEDRTGLSVYALAMFGIALEKQGEKEKLAMVIRNIGQYLQQDDENQTAWLNLPGRYWWCWYGSEYEAHAYYLKLLARTDPKGEVARRLVKYLLNNRKHATYWKSTRDTALCIEAMADFIRRSGEDKPAMTVQVLVDGKPQKSVEITSRNLFLFDNKLVIEGQKLTAGEHPIELRKQGIGPLYYNGYLTNFTLEDFITKAGLEVKVNRKYYKLEKVDKTIKAAGSRGQAVDQRVEKYRRQELPNLAMLQSGDLCEIELEIDSKNDYEYLVFEDFKPAGFEPVELRSGYNGNDLGAYMEFRDNRVVFFVHRLARGKHSVSYRMRAEIPGRFSALPTKAWAMYAPELKANSDEIKLQVKD